MPTFTEVSRRLVLRYRHGNAFSYAHLVHGATAEGVFELAEAIADLQTEQPTRKTLVRTEQLI